MNKLLATLAIVFSIAAQAQTNSLNSSPSSTSTAPQNETPQSPELNEAARLNGQAIQLFNERKYEEALPLARRVLEIRERVLGANHQLVGIALYNLAAILAERRDLDESERLYQRALAIYENNLGADNPSIANILDSFALMLLAKQEYGAAERMYRRALEVRERALGTEHLSVGQSHFNLGRFYHARRRSERAEESYRRALAIREAALGASHRDVAVVLENLSTLLRQENRDAEAADLENRAYAIHNGTNASDNSGTRMVRGGVLTGRAIVRVAPEYPQGALIERASGTVVVQVLVDENGRVVSARAISGHRTLRQAAEAAARQWRFSPTRLEGQPVRVNGTLSFNFNIM